MNYLYNGIELPDINEVWSDKETYPYASLFKTNDAFALILSNFKYIYNKTNNVSEFRNSDFEDVKASKYIFTDKENVVESFAENGIDLKIGEFSKTEDMSIERFTISEYVTLLFEDFSAEGKGTRYRLTVKEELETSDWDRLSGALVQIKTAEGYCTVKISGMTPFSKYLYIDNAPTHEIVEDDIALVETSDFEIDNSPFWANEDILDENGEVYLEASEPVLAIIEARYRIRKSTLVEIADSVRAKTGKTAEIPVTSLAKEIDGIEGGGTETAYVVGEPIIFTLSANNWNGTTYTISAEGFIKKHEPQIGLPEISSAANAEQVVKSALTIPQTSVSTNSQTGISTVVIYIAAVTAPTVDIDIALFGLEAQGGA